MAPTRDLLLVVAIICGRAFGLDNGCQVAVNGDLPDPQPLLLQPNGPLDVTGFLQPNTAGIINLKKGDQVLVACPSANNYIKVLGKDIAEATVTCEEGKMFSYKGKNYRITELACNFNPTSEALATGAKCYNSNTEIKIGFQVSRGFVKTVDVCFDENVLGAVYSLATVVAGIEGYQSDVARPEFKRGTFYGNLNPDNYYKPKTQTTTVGTLLGSKDLGPFYISTTKPKADYFLARGHLTAKGYFVFGTERRSTFFYMNAAPQWQTLNGGNWEALEKNVIKLASSMNVNLQVYTGTHGLATLPNVQGTETPLYLTTTGKLPVPLFFWKVVYDPTSKAGVAMVGINNPYVKMADKPELVVCPNVCDQIKWFKWQSNNVEKGEGYCCEVAELRRAVPSVPNLTINKLLA